MNSCRTSGNNGTLIQNTSLNSGNHIENEYFSIDLPGNYSLNKIQGTDGVIYYIESKTDETVKKHGEIFRGFHPGTVESYYDNNNKIETVFVEILNQIRDLGIYFERNVYSTISIIPIKNNDGFETYIRIIGFEDNKEKIYELIKSFSTLKIKTPAVHGGRFVADFTAHNRSVTATGPKGPSALRSARSLRSHASLWAHLGGTKPYGFLYSAAQTSVTAGTLGAIIFKTKCAASLRRIKKYIDKFKKLI
jgi:hypothetical protein